jgi:hypothetical protein
MADAAEFRQEECGEHRGRHAVGLLQRDAVHDALPARVAGGLRFQGLDRSAACSCGNSHQFLHSERRRWRWCRRRRPRYSCARLPSLAPPIMILSLSRACVLNGLDGLLHRSNASEKADRPTTSGLNWPISSMKVLTGTSMPCPDLETVDEHEDKCSCRCRAGRHARCR